MPCSSFREGICISKRFTGSYIFQLGSFNTPVQITGYKPTATIIIDSTKVDQTKLAALETILYGVDKIGEIAAVDPRLPLPDEVLATLKTA